MNDTYNGSIHWAAAKTNLSEILIDVHEPVDASKYVLPSPYIKLDLDFPHSKNKWMCIKKHISIK